MIWVMMALDQPSHQKLEDFFVENYPMKRKRIKKGMHLTIYHARRPLVGLSNDTQDISIRIDSRDLRFMVMVPGGENKRPDVDPESNPIGLRVTRQSAALGQILELRQQFLGYETPKVLGERKASSARRNAFGARHFQPHITVLWSGKELGDDLTPAGTKFRAAIDFLHFDRLIVDCKEPKPLVGAAI